MRPTLIYGAIILAAIASSAIADEADDKMIEPGSFKGKILKSIVGDSHIWHVARAGAPGNSALYARWCKPILRPPHLSCTGPWKLLQFPGEAANLSVAGILSGGTLVVVSDAGMMSRCLFDSGPCGKAVSVKD